MDEIEQIIREAFAIAYPRLSANPAEMRRRLADRPINFHPRAWCLTLRATDARLETYLQSTDPTHPFTLSPSEIYRLCTAVWIDRPSTRAQVTALLGTSASNLLHARLHGHFQTRYLPGYAGRWGKPRPLLSAHEPLDPASRGFGLADPLFQRVRISLINHIPHDLPPQKLQRVPQEYRLTDAYLQQLAAQESHPELGLPSKRRSLALPPLPPDYVWYKWKDGQYLGYDWRNPLAAANYLRHQKELQNARAAAKRRRLKNPPPGKSQGSIQFRGWRWLCPRCGRKVNLIYLPLPPIQLLPDRPVPAPSQFACNQCHRLRRSSGADPNAWNELIRYLSFGLLYGHEVPRPSWFPRPIRLDRARIDADPIPDLTPPTALRRKLPYIPRPNRPPSLRREQIEQRLLAGDSFRQIAKELGLVYGTILWYAQQVYKQHHVRSLPELLQKHGHAPSLSKRKQILQRFLMGESIQQIASEMKISPMCVYNHIYMLRRSGAIPPRHAARAEPRRCAPAITSAH